MAIDNKSGAKYSLRQLFGENLHLVIPDMQRDYCWGIDRATDNLSPDKVTTFVKTIARLYQGNTPTTLGLIYGYEEPKGSNHLMIIDGQQRLTTLFLLIGMLYRRTPRPDIRKLLIADYELLDDRQPRLMYQTRSEAIYFISDLVTNFFLNRNGRLSQLEKSQWYCASYDSDTTVKSFIGAIRLIDTVMEDLCTSDKWDFDEFADFVIDDLQFYYHDLGDRPHAEEMFITINTTGEPLTLQQNLKTFISFLSHDADENQKWEEMEQWAWEKRSGRSEDQPTTSDERFDQMIEIWKFYNDKINDNHLDFDQFYNFFCTYRILTEAQPQLLDYRHTDPEGMFVVLPTMEYIEKWHLTDVADKRKISEFANLLTNITRYQRIPESGAYTKLAIEMTSLMADSDISSLLKVRCPNSSKILTAEEAAKLTLLTQMPGSRKALLKSFRKAEMHPLLFGKVHKVIKWCENKGAPGMSIKKFDYYINLIYNIFGEDINQKAELDDLRRFLLSLRKKDYPIARRGDTSLTLCWQEYEWQRLMSQSPGFLKLALDRIGQANCTKDTIKSLYKKFADKSYPFFFLIKDEKLLSECAHRSLMRPCEVFLGYHVAEKLSIASTAWFVEQTRIKIDRASWSNIRVYGSRCLYTDHKNFNIAIDLYYTPDSREKFKIEIFSRQNAERDEQTNRMIRALFDGIGYRPSYDKKRKRLYISLSDGRTAASVLNRLLKNC